MEHQDSRSELLTSDQVVERLLAHPVLRPLALRWVLPQFQLGNEIVYRLSDLEAWMKREIQALERHARPK